MKENIKAKIKARRKELWHRYQITKIIIVAILALLLLVSGYMFYLAKSVDVASLKDGYGKSAQIFDKNDSLAGSLYGQKGTIIEYNQVNPQVIDALISTEDRDFYKHGGFSVKSFARAAVGRLTFHNRGGGSTITQQLAKNAYLSFEQTMTRKLKELFLAIEINKAYTKEEILTLYLNNVYFGDGVWGIEDAAHHYFGKSAADLDLDEGATLVGMLKGPEYYNPYYDITVMTNRRNTVLSLMAENGKITKEQADQEMTVDLQSELKDNYTKGDGGYSYPYYFDAIISEATSLTKIKEQDFLNKGYKIYTELDTNYQKAMDKTGNSPWLFPKNSQDSAIVEFGSVALDPKTGAINGIVGGRGEHVYRGFNYATQLVRSPGSTIKPIVDYTPALLSGNFEINSMLENKEQSYYDAKNFEKTNDQDIPMYQALARSLNLPAVYTMHEVGVKKAVEEGKIFGLPLTDQDENYSTGLGGLSKGVSPLEMARAYAAFANGGKLVDVYIIRKIEDANGKKIYTKKETAPQRIIDEKTADKITSMLLGVMSNGTGVKGRVQGYQIAGKTGTTETNWDPTLTNDQWLVGYTKDVVVANWIGYEKPSEDRYLPGTAHTTSAAIFQNEMAGILPHTQGTKFEVPDAYTVQGNLDNYFAHHDYTGDQTVVENAADLHDEFKKHANALRENTNTILQKTGEATGNFFQRVGAGFQQLFNKQ
ncbi:MAG: PBP1A family penicillin-binding protein [Lactobacillales bacterium]|jgi:penicillin-binding protein 2A|nr:PBP1A family penicillin-binding protein [Lactobacillales bacterium]